jgi:hypothetical protein
MLLVALSGCSSVAYVASKRLGSWTGGFNGGCLTRHRPEKDDHDLRPCAPCGVVASLIRQRSGDHIHRRRRQMLVDLLAIVLELGCDFNRLTLFASVAVHMCLERTGASEAFVTDLALVLLLAAR